MLDIFLRKNIKSGIKNLEKRKREFLTYESIRNILILFDYNNWQDVEPILEDLERNGKRVILWTILHKGDTAPIQNFHQNVRVIDLQKDVNWKKVLRPEIVEEFSKLDYETLLDLSFSDDNYMTLLRANSSASFNVGFRELDYDLFEFIILKEESMTLYQAYEQMKIYQEHIEQN